MRFMIQRVKEASVTVDGQVVGKIGKGLLVFIGISHSDFFDEKHSIEAHSALNIADKMVKKLIGLRIFEDENGKTNLDIKSVKGQFLLISQFTLYADCRKGNRPSFVNAGDPQKANDIYRYIIEKCRQEMEEKHSMEEGHSMEEDTFGKTVQEGIFGAEMEVSLINDGPFTIMLDSVDICK